MISFCVLCLWTGTDFQNTWIEMVLLETHWELPSIQSPGKYWFKTIFDVYFSAWGFLGHMDSTKTCGWPMLQICSRECGQGLTLHIPKKSLALSQPLGGHLHDLGMSFLIRVSLFAWDLGSCWIVYADYWPCGISSTSARAREMKVSHMYSPLRI